ncbi:MAG: FAD:protein FMN transferase [Candidatus Latescibacterota bacterium]
MDRNRKRVRLRSRTVMLIGVIPVLAVLWLFMGAHRGVPQRIESTEFHMNTGISITLFVHDRAEGEKLFRKAFDEIARIERVLEPLKGNGDLQRINAGSAGTWWEMNPDIRTVLVRSKYYYDLSGGVFDPTIGPAKWLWNFENGGKIPESDALNRALKLVGLNKIEISGNRFRFTVPGMKLDFGAIAKGYAVDRMAAALRENGVKTALINAGGNIITIGRKPDNSDWVIGVRHPRKEETVLVKPVPNTAVATSGDYERFFMKDGVRYHHILDPGTGYPAGKCIGATVWTSNAMDADALSTTLFLLGPEKGIEFAKKLKVETLIYFEKDGRIGMAMTPGVVGRVKP